MNYTTHVIAQFQLWIRLPKFKYMAYIQFFLLNQHKDYATVNAKFVENTETLM
jgi:hypothetical protein